MVLKSTCAPPPPSTPLFLLVTASVPLEDDGTTDEDAHQEDHGPDSRKGSGLRGGRGLALGEARSDDQGCNHVLVKEEGGGEGINEWTGKEEEGATCMHVLSLGMYE